MITLNIGNVVQLKSGGAEMTIDHMKDDFINCIWFNGGQVISRTFPKDSLVLVKTNSEALADGA